MNLLQFIPLSISLLGNILLLRWYYWWYYCWGRGCDRKHNSLPKFTHAVKHKYFKEMISCMADSALKKQMLEYYYPEDYKHKG